MTKQESSANTEVHMHSDNLTVNMQGWAIQQCACRRCVWLNKKLANPTVKTTTVCKNFRIMKALTAIELKKKCDILGYSRCIS